MKLEVKICGSWENGNSVLNWIGSGIRYTSADGFLFLQDDTILNYWNLLQADRTKLWIANKVIYL